MLIEPVTAHINKYASSKVVSAFSFHEFLLFPSETTQGTPENELAKKRLIDYHADYKRRGGRQERERYKYLTKKLNHIKQLITNYQSRPEHA